MPRRSTKPTGAVWALLQQWSKAEYGLSQEQMAKRLGVSGSTVSNWKHMEQAFTQQHQVVFAEKSGISRILISLAADADLPRVSAHNDRRSEANVTLKPS